MPTYEYACTSCGEQVEKVQRFSDDPLTVCPACGGTLRKVFSPVGIVFKGSGFYRTDSRKASVAMDDKGAKTNGSSGSGEGSASADKKDSSAGQDSSSSSSSKDSSAGKSSGKDSSDTKKSGDAKSSQPASAGSST